MSGPTYLQASISENRVLLKTRCAEDPLQGGYVAVQPRFVGICRSDVKEVQGARPIRSDFGHELVAAVVHTRGVAYPTVGSIVALDPHVPLATRTTAYGTIMELSATNEALGSALISLPKVLNDPVGVFVEPLACAIHCVDRAKTALGSVPASADVLGAGTAGLLIAAHLAHIGCEVHLLNRTRDRLAFLKDIDAEALGIRLATSAAPPEASFVATTAFANGLSMLDVRTPKRIVVAYGGTSPGETWRGVPVDHLRRRELMARIDSLDVVGSYGATSSDFVKAVETLSASATLRSLLTRYLVDFISLDQLPQTLLQLTQRRQMGKVVVMMESSSWTS